MNLKFTTEAKKHATGRRFEFTSAEIQNSSFRWESRQIATTGTMHLAGCQLFELLIKLASVSRVAFMRSSALQMSSAASIERKASSRFPAFMFSLLHTHTHTHARIHTGLQKARFFKKKLSPVVFLVLLSPPMERSKHWRRLWDWSFCQSLCVCVSICEHDDSSSSPHVTHNRQEWWRPPV